MIKRNWLVSPQNLLCKCPDDIHSTVLICYMERFIVSIVQIFVSCLALTNLI